MKRTETPKHLGPNEAAFWAEIQAEYAVTDAQGLATLTLAAETLQRLRQAREIIERDGIIVDGKPHPLLLVERDSRKGFSSLMNSLGLDAVAAGDVGRPTTVSLRRVG